jgi:UDP-glucose 4-epimerase
LRNGCERLIFRSTAAIYRASEDLTVDEESPIQPSSPYGHSKAMCETIFAGIASVHPLHVLSLRYFNPIGADPKMRTGLQLRRPTHALGAMIRAHDERGDVAGAYTRIDRAKRLLGWVPQHDLHDGIRHSLQWAAIRDEILPGAVRGSA